MKNQVMEMLKLAVEKNLTVRTDSIARDQKHKQLVITEEISEINAEGVTTRSGIYYSITDDVENHLVNDKIMEAKARAIAAYCGLEFGETTSSAPVEETQETEVEEAPEEDVVEKPAKKTRKKKATSAAAKKKAAKAPPKAEEVEEDEDDLLDDSEEDSVQIDDEVINYDHKDKEHNGYLREVVIRTYGKEWKKNKAATTAVKKAIAKLDGKVPVTSADGELLPSFAKECKALLAS